MPALGEKRQEPLTNLGSLHDPWSLGAAAARHAGQETMQVPSNQARTLQERWSFGGETCALRQARARCAESVPTITRMLLAERLVGEARVRRASSMDRHERTVTLVSAIVFGALAIALAVLVDDQRDANLWVTGGLLVGYAVLLHVRFEFGGYYASPEQLAYVPLLLLGPLPWVPLLIAIAGAASMLPDIVRDHWHRDRWLGAFADSSWPYMGGVVVLLLFAPGPIEAGLIWIYLLALVAHFASDLAWTLIRNFLLDRLPVRTVIDGFSGTALVDAILTPIALVVAFPAARYPLCLLAIIPLVGLFQLFSHDRRERYSKTLELHRAYRGVVMLLSDVVEHDDEYTGSHSRSVVDLANAVADELGIDSASRQELEFAAMLHDVGKIAIPKEILNKPAALTDTEFEVMKTHTIEGQFMLDRVGGLLARVGEIVRSCHERWDGRGYPDGLKGEQIPLAARIVFACDAYHAMTSDRVYRAALPRSVAISELTDNAGTQFDPEVVAALTAVVDHGEPVGASSDDVRALLASAPVPGDVRTTAAG
jgi:HD-GYP domain-containing protein (c-di-GMP phosphodiesterase class II)